VRSEIDTNSLPKGLVISDADFAALKIDLDAFHGEWNYSIQRWLPVEVVSLFVNRPLTGP